MPAVCLALATACSYAPSANPVDGAGDAPADAPADVSIDAVVCPAGFAILGGATSQYRVGATALAYMPAVLDCANAGARVHLARLDTQAETDALFGLVGEFVRVVGQRHVNDVSNPADDTWHDLDDTTVLAFQPWGQGEPTNQPGELCMTVREEFSGDPPPIVTGADDCTTPRAYVCECE